MVHDDDLVGDFQGFFLVVRDQNAGDAQFVVDVAQPGTQFFAHFGIECAKGFVQQQQFGFDRKGAGEGDALALAARKLVRVGFGQVGKLYQFQQFFDLAADLFFRRPLTARQYGQPESHVVENIHVAE